MGDNHSQMYAEVLLDYSRLFALRGWLVIITILLLLGSVAALLARLRRPGVTGTSAAYRISPKAIAPLVLILLVGCGEVLNGLTRPATVTANTVANLLTVGRPGAPSYRLEFLGGEFLDLPRDVYERLVIGDCVEIRYITGLFDTNSPYLTDKHLLYVARLPLSACE